jgi:hypothetical protein
MIFFSFERRSFPSDRVSRITSATTHADQSVAGRRCFAIELVRQSVDFVLIARGCMILEVSSGAASQ